MLLLGSAKDVSTQVGTLGWAASPTFGTFNQFTLPSGLNFNNFLPDFITYQRYTYVVGQYSPGLVIDPHNLKVYQNGIPRPGVAPVIAAAAGAPGITATDVIGYVTFAIKLPDGKILMESNPSPESNTIGLSSQSIDWSNLPTACANPAVNTIRLYRSVAGTVPRFAAERDLGTSTVSGEEVPTLALGSQLPNTEGTLNNAHGVPPNCRAIESYGERAWYAIDPVFPDRVWFSEIGKPWAVGPISFFATRDGEAVTGIKKLRDQLIVFCKRSTYVIQLFSADIADAVQTKISPNIGTISHHSIVNIDNRLWFAGEDGVYTYDGSFQYQMEDLRDYWKGEYTDTANDWKTAYENCYGSDDRFWRTYKLLIPRPSDLAEIQGFFYIGHYSFGPTMWSFDQRARRERCQLGHSMQYVFTGSDDGFVRLENAADNFNDNNDTDIMKLLIRTPLLLFDKPGGDAEEGGKIFHKLYTYLESESNDWELRVVAGDEDAYQQFTPDNTLYYWKDDVGESLLVREDVEGFDYTYCAKSVHVHYPELVAGRGLMIEIYAEAPENMKYRGFGGYFGPGPAGRKPRSRIPHDPG